MSHLSLYTIILEYKGGTYISQIQSESPTAAVKKWSTTITEHSLAVWGWIGVILYHYLTTIQSP